MPTTASGSQNDQQAQEHFNEIRSGNSTRWPPPHPKGDFRGTDRGTDELSAEEDFGFDTQGFFGLRGTAQSDLTRINGLIKTMCNLCRVLQIIRWQSGTLSSCVG